MILLMTLFGLYPNLGAIPRQDQIPQRMFPENEEKEREDVPLTEEQQ